MLLESGVRTIKEVPPLPSSPLPALFPPLPPLHFPSRPSYTELRGYNSIKFLFFKMLVGGFKRVMDVKINILVP